MIITSLLIPAWKSRDYSLAMEVMAAPGVIYLRRSGIYYVRNKHGVKLKFSVSESDKAFYDKAYTDKSTISLGIIAVVSTGSAPIVRHSRLQ